MSRLSLRELHDVVLAVLDDEWRTPSEVCAALRLGHGDDWTKVALTLERLANDGVAELKTPGSMVRRFRLRRETT